VTAAVVPPAAPPAEAQGTRRTGLLRAELHRFRARRFLRVLLLLGLAGWVAAVAIALSHYGRPSDADLTAARQQVAELVAESDRAYDQCVADPQRPPDQPVGQTCGERLTSTDIDAGHFLAHPPFSLTGSADVGVMGFGAVAALIAFVAGATWIGAEWSTRSLVALLFWEPRRLRVVATKAGVLLAGTAAFGVLAQAAWLGMAGLLEAVAGDGAALPAGFWGGELAMQGRAVLLTVLAGLGGFALANLIRNTAAALGVGFVYFAVVETAVRGFWPAWQPWLVTNNVVGLLSPRGLHLFLPDGIGPDGQQAMREYVLGNLQSGIFLSCAVAVFVAAGAVLFARRDLH
jgi:ABC-2 type transport system permease protein